MSNQFESRNREAFDPSALRRSMAERDPERIHFEHKYGEDAIYLDKDDQEKKISRVKGEIEENVAYSYSSTSIDKTAKTEEKPVDLSRLSEHEKLEEERFNRAGQIASGFINEAVLKSHGVSNQEFKLLKPEDKELLVDRLSENNPNYVTEGAKFQNLGWKKEEYSLLSKNDRDLILSRNINRASLKEEDFLMKKLGYSLNETLYVVSEEDRKNILEKKISRDEWIALSRQKYSPQKDVVKVASPETFRGGSDLRDPFEIKRDARKQKNSEKILKFELNSMLKKFEAALKVKQKEGDNEGVQQIRLDMEQVKKQLASLSSNSEVGENKKNHHWPPKDSDLKPGVIRHWPPVGENTTTLSPENFRGGSDLADPFKQIEDGQTPEVAKGGENKKYIQDLGYSPKEILSINPKDQNRIVEEQIPPSVWFSSGESASNGAQEEGKEEVSVDSEERSTLIKEEFAGLDGTYIKRERAVTAKEARESIDEKLKQQAGQTVVGSQKTVFSQNPANQESNLASNAESVAVVSAEYEKNKDTLEKLGWSVAEYSSLTQEERTHVLWKGIKEENYSRNKTEGSESQEASDAEVFDLAQILYKRRSETGKLELEESKKKFFNENKERIKAEIVKLIASEKEKFQLSARGVSEGAKEFLADQKLGLGLEKGYENLSKDQLIQIAKQKNLTSGGDKQKIIERIAQDDVEKKRSDSNFAEGDVRAKLEEFNLSEKDIILLSPEFFSLSPAKQTYLLSKLEQKIYRDADFASKDKNEEEMKSMGFWKKLGSSFVKGQRQVALRDKMIEEIKSGGIKNYRKDILTLNAYLLDAPELTYEPNKKGKLAPHFEYVKTISSDKKFETPKVFFNVAASRFGEIPFEWSLPSATSRQQEMYQEAYLSYTGAKDTYVKAVVEEAVRKNPKISDDEKKDLERNARVEVLGVDAKVKFGSFITQNPEMETLSSNFVEKVLGAKASDFARGALFAGAGFATKWLGRSMMVTGVGLGAAMGVGGYMEWRKKNLEYKEKELRQRYGKESNDLWLKKAANSSNVYSRLEKLVDQFEKAADGDAKKKILETIKTRVFVTEEMMRDGRINFGSQKEQVANQFKLAEMMSKATVSIAMNGGFGGEKTKEEEIFDRFKQFVQDSGVQKEKNKARTMAFVKGASVGLLGFEIGYGLRYAQEHGYLGAAWEAISEKGSEGLNKAKEIVSNFYSENTTSPSKVIPTIIENTPNIENPLPVETVMAGSRGVIGAIDDMQDKLRVKFGTNVPDEYKEFLSKDPNKLAREWGFYKPGEVNESAVIKKGEGFSIDSKGVVRFVGLNGTDEVYVPQGVKDVSPVPSERKFFDGARTGLASTESPSIETGPSSSFESTPVQRPEVQNEGYVVSKEVKSAPTNWFEKPVPTEFGASNVRGTWKFVEDANGRIVKVDTSRTISDDVIKFRQNPRNFLNADLNNTNLPTKTDSFAVKTLTENKVLAEKFLTEKNLLNAPNSNLTEKEITFLRDSVSTLDKELKLKTGGAFDGKYQEPTVFGRVEKPSVTNPQKISYFDTDKPITPKINPSVTSVSEGSDFVPEKAVKPTVPPAETSSEKIKIEEPTKEILNKNVEIISLGADQKTYSFNTENVKGKLRFMFDEKGVVTNLQKPNSTIIRVGQVENILSDGWMSKAKEFSLDEATGIKKIRGAAALIKEYTAILEEGGFKPNSAEYNYLQQEIKFIKGEYKEVLK